MVSRLFVVRHRIRNYGWRFGEFTERGESGDSKEGAHQEGINCFARFVGQFILRHTHTHTGGLGYFGDSF